MSEGMVQLPIGNLSISWEQGYARLVGLELSIIEGTPAITLAWKGVFATNVKGIVVVTNDKIISCSPELRFLVSVYDSNGDQLDLDSLQEGNQEDSETAEQLST